MSTFVSYAQNCEDVMLWRALQHVSNGFYVDVGAQHPLRDSVTQAFYERGWRGINIDPVSEWYGLLGVGRPEDINLQFVISSKPGEAVFYEVENTGLSTMDAHLAAMHAAKGMSVRMGVLPMRTLDSVLSEYHTEGDIHFLKIDVEGAEESVLRGLSLDQYRPWIILLEATLPNTQIDVSDSCSSLLKGMGYEPVYFDGLNRYYVASEKRELGEHFQVPPNFFDNFVRHPDWERGELARRLGEDIRVVRDSERKAVESLELVRRELDATHVQHGAELSQLRNDHGKAICSLQEGHALELFRLCKERDDFASLSQSLHEHSELTKREMEEGRRSMMAQLDDSRREIESAAEQMEILRMERSRADARLASQGRAIDALLRSRSWRITAPLRWISALIGVAREMEQEPSVRGEAESTVSDEGYGGVPDEDTLLALAKVMHPPSIVPGGSPVSSTISNNNAPFARFDRLIGELHGLLLPPQNLPHRMRWIPGSQWLARPILRLYERAFRKQTLFNTKLLEVLKVLRDSRN